MFQTSQAAKARFDLQAATLAQLLPLPQQSRYASILHSGRSDLTATLGRLRDEGVPLPSGFDAERLAWAVAFNIEGPPASGQSANSGSRRGAQGYADRWPLDTAWHRIWSALIAPIEPKSAGVGKPTASTLLAELALSIACEQRDDWQNPGSSPIEMADVNRAFDFVWARDNSKVMGDIYRGFGARTGDPESIAQEAWARVFCNFERHRPAPVSGHVAHLDAGLPGGSSRGVRCDSRRSGAGWA
jgi:hypothetical protein